MTRMDQMEESLKNYQPFNPDGLIGEMAKQSCTSIRKIKQILELEIKDKEQQESLTKLIYATYPLLKNY